MGKPTAPTPPDPKDTAAAQTGTNINTSLANTYMGNVNQVGPDGSTLTYDQTGSQSFTDPFTGQTYDVPQFTATQSLSDGAQGIFDSQQSAKANFADTAQNQSAFLKDHLSQPFDGSTGAIEKHLFDMGSKTLDPKFEQQRDALETRLSNQGIKMGSEAHDRAIGDFRDSRGSAYNDLALRGRGQAFSEITAQRNQPINEIMAMLGGSQVRQPNFAVNKPSGIPTTDVAGLIGQNFGQKQQNYQTDMANWQGGIGGLFGLGAGII